MVMVRVRIEDRLRFDNHMALQFEQFELRRIE